MNSIELLFKDGMRTTIRGDVELDCGIAAILMWRKRAFVFDGTEDGIYYYHEVTVVTCK